MTRLSIDIPVIETERLVLREPREADFDAMHAFGQSDRSHFVGGPYANWQTWGALTGNIGQWVLRGFGFWTVEERTGGALVGRIGVIHPVDWPEPELAWHVYDGFEGRGLAYEAAMAARAYADAKLGLGPLISQIHADNIRSRRLAERMGATVEREGSVRGTPCLIYRHPGRAA